jgi:hypothetical protein
VLYGKNNELSPILSRARKVCCIFLKIVRHLYET